MQSEKNYNKDKNNPALGSSGPNPTIRLSAWQFGF